MSEPSINVKHDGNDRVMTFRVVELAHKPPSLERYKEICDIAYLGFRHALRHYYPLYAKRAWVAGIMHLLSVPPMDEVSARLGQGFSLEDARFVEKCFAPLVPLFAAHWREVDQDGFVVPSAVNAMYSEISRSLGQCRERGEKFSLFNVLFEECELVPGSYRFRVLGTRRKERVSLVESPVGDVEEFLFREDNELLDYYAAFVRDGERHDAAEKELDDYNDSLGLEQISVDFIMGFIESYGGEAPRKPTEKIVRDLTAIFRFKPCASYESETDLYHIGVCETHYHRYSLDDKNIGDETITIQDAVACFIKDQLVAAETVEEANRLEAICKYFFDYRHDAYPGEAIEAIIGEFRRVYSLKHRQANEPAAKLEPARKRSMRGVGGKGLKTEFMKRQLRAFERFLSAHGCDGDESRLYALANQCWLANKRKWDKAKSAEGQNKGYSCPKVLADAYKKAM